MKDTILILKAMGVEGIVIAVALLLTAASLIVTVAGVNTTDGTGVHIGADVPETGTNPWQ